MEIDGSLGEGGGQILRTSFALSAITGQDIEVNKIRANRPKKGLAAQHITSIRAVSEICSGKLHGDQKGSGTVSFIPGKISHGDYEFDIGTAGSVTLALQAIMPVLFSIPGTSDIVLKGGTDVKWAPPVDYVRDVLFPFFRHYGIECEMNIVKRGYYPKGGGEIHVKIRSPHELKYEPGQKGLNIVKAVINISGLSHRIAQRMEDAVRENISPMDMDIQIDDRKTNRSPGIGIVLSYIDQDRFMGIDMLGEKGVPAGTIGKRTANGLMSMINSNVTIDDLGCDQIMTLIVLGKSNPEIIFSKKTKHIETNLDIINMFMPDTLEINKLDDYYILTNINKFVQGQ